MDIQGKGKELCLVAWMAEETAGMRFFIWVATAFSIELEFVQEDRQCGTELLVSSRVFIIKSSLKRHGLISLRWMGGIGS